MTEERYIEVHRGSPPWEPSQGADLVAELKHYDMPLVGFVLQAGALYLFQCVAGQVEPVSAWVYTRVSPAEVREIHELALTDISDEDFDETLSNLCDHRPGTIALAVEGFGAVASRQFGIDISEPDFHRLLDGLYGELDQSLEQVKVHGSRQHELVRQLVG